MMSGEGEYVNPWGQDDPLFSIVSRGLARAQALPPGMSAVLSRVTQSHAYCVLS